MNVQTGRGRKQLSTDRDDRQLIKKPQDDIKWPTKRMTNGCWDEVHGEDIFETGSYGQGKAKQTNKKTHQWEAKKSQAEDFKTP